MLEEDLTRDRSHRAAKRRAAYLKQVNAILTATGLALMASALWKPVLEHTGPFGETALLTVGAATMLLALTIIMAPYTEAM